MSLSAFLDVRTILFTFYGYEMSYLELVGTVLNLLAVWWATRERVISWPVGIVAVLLFMALFYQIQLYSDFFEQIYYLVTNFYGWYLWGRREPGAAQAALPVARAGARWIGIAAAITAAGTVMEGYFMSRIHVVFPRYFTEPASYPYLDAFTTVLSFVGQIFMAHKKIECWWIWVIVNVLGVGLYFAKGAWLLAALFFVFLLLSFKGYFSWKKELPGR